MDSRRSSVSPRERPSSRGSSIASFDGRRSNVWSRNSSLLPHSTRSDGSGFNYGEASTLSRAVLHNTEDERTEHTFRMGRTGWHHDPRRREDDDDAASEDRVRRDRRRKEATRELLLQEEEEHAFHDEDNEERESATSKSGFHLPPFHRNQHRPFDSMSAEEVSGSSLPRSAPPAASSRHHRTYSSHSELGSVGTAVSSGIDNDDAPSYTNSNSRAFRSGYRFSFASPRRGEHGGGWPEEEGSLRSDASSLLQPHSRRSRRGSRAAMGVAGEGGLGSFASSSSAHHLQPRATSLPGASAERLSGVSSRLANGTSMSSLRRRRSVSATDNGLDGSGQLSSVAKRGTSETNSTALAAAVAAGGGDDVRQTLSLDSPFPVYGVARGDPLTSWDATPAAEDHVWPFTQPIEVRLIRTQVRKRAEWNDTMRQFLLLIPLVFLVIFLVAFNTVAVRAGLLVTESLRQLFIRTPFPSTQTALESFRQQKQLGLLPSVPTDRLFEEIRTQTEWIDYVADVLLPGVFPDLNDVLAPASAVSGPCDNKDGSSKQSSSGSTLCFEDGHYWWDRPGCAMSSSADDVQAQELLRVAEIRATLATQAAPATDSLASSMSFDGGATGTLTNIPSDNPCTSDEFLYSATPRIGPAQNIYLGALRLRTIRLRPHTAKLQRGLYPANSTAVPMDAWNRGHGSAYEETTPLRCPSIAVENPFTNESTQLYRYVAPNASEPYCVPTMGRFGDYHCGGYIVDIPFRSSRWRAAQYRDAIRDVSCFFVDNWATRMVVAEFFTYTPDHDTFHMVKLRSEVVAGGAYVNEAVFRSFRVWTPARTGELVYVSVLLAYVVVYVGYLVVRLRWQVRWTGWLETVQDLSAWMDLCVTSAVVVSVGHYYAWVRLSRQVSPLLLLPLDSDAYPSSLDAVQTLSNRSAVSAAASVILCFFRIFFFRALFRPFSTIVAALDLSLPTLFFTSAIFLILAIGYAIVANAVFGPVSAFYTTFGDALYAVLSSGFSVPLIVTPDAIVARQFTSLFWWSFTMMLFGMSLALNFATVSHSFSRIQAVYGATYDVRWLLRRLRALGECCTWPRVKWFVGKMIFVYPESEYLFSLLASMDAAYFSEGVMTAQTTTSGSGATSRGAASSLLCRATADVNATPGRTNADLTDSSTTPLSFNGAAKRAKVVAAGSVVEGQNTGAATSTSPPTSYEGGRGNGGAVASQRHAVSVPFSAGGSSNPLMTASAASRSATGTTQNDAYRGSGSGGGDGVPARGGPVRRTSDELREIYDELRGLTAVQRRITFFDWCDVIPRDVFEKCGGMKYFKDWWQQLAEAQADVSRTPQQQGRREFRAKVALATEREVAAGIVGIGRLENTLTQLELHVDSLLRNVSKR